MARRDLLEFTEYHSPDGEIYHFDTHELFLLSSTGMGLSPVKYLQQRGPFQHGSTIYDYRLEQRIIQLVHRAQGCSRDEYWEKRGELVDLLRPNRQLINTFNLGKLRKIFEDGSMRDIDVFIEQGPIFTPRDTSRWDEWAFTETLRFIAPDPTFYNPTQQSQVWTWVAGDELVFPFTFEGDMLVFLETFLSKTETVTYAGTWLAYPSFTIVGPADGFTIENQTTDEKLEYIRFVNAGETITISLEYGNKSIESSVYGNVIGYLSSDSDLATFHLAPDPEATDGENNINIFIGSGVDGTTAVTMNWYTRYIGI